MKILLAILLVMQIHFCMGQQQYPQMIKLEGGTFYMGSGNVAELPLSPFRQKQPTHHVTLTSFSISRTEVTVSQWVFFCKETGRIPHSQTAWQNDAPITKVSWIDVVAYCQWLSQKTNKKYRLPTEAEWEFAARGGNNSKGYPYSGSKIIDSVGWYKDNGDGRPHVVAGKRPNELGIYDMSGNVWEWCADWNAAYPNEPVVNPKGPANGKFRIVRGGSFRYSSANCLVINRNIRPSDYTNIDLGFRVVSVE